MASYTGQRVPTGYLDIYVAFHYVSFVTEGGILEAWEKFEPIICSNMRRKRLLKLFNIWAIFK